MRRELSCDPQRHFIAVVQSWMTSPDEVNEQESVSHEIAIVSLDEGEVDPGQAVGETDKASKICRQIEHYFSDANLPTDEYLLTRIRRNKQGWGEPWPTCLPWQQKSSDSLLGLGHSSSFMHSQVQQDEEALQGRRCRRS